MGTRHPSRERDGLLRPHGGSGPRRQDVDPVLLHRRQHVGRHSARPTRAQQRHDHGVVDRRRGRDLGGAGAPPQPRPARPRPHRRGLERRPPPRTPLRGLERRARLVHPGRLPALPPHPGRRRQDGERAEASRDHPGGQTRRHRAGRPLRRCAARHLLPVLFPAQRREEQPDAVLHHAVRGRWRDLHRCGGRLPGRQSLLALRPDRDDQRLHAADRGLGPARGDHTATTSTSSGTRSATAPPTSGSDAPPMAAGAGPTPCSSTTTTHPGPALRWTTA